MCIPAWLSNNKVPARCYVVCAISHGSGLTCIATSAEIIDIAHRVAGGVIPDVRWFAVSYVGIASWGILSLFGDCPAPVT